MTAKTTKLVMGFGMVVFILLGVLFGAMIMTFIFGNIGNIDVITDSSGSVSNETGAYINATGYTLVKSSVQGFAAPVITAAINTTSNTTILAGNYTVSAAGVVTNATVANFDSVWISYTYTYYSDAEINTRDVNNDSLSAIENYSGQSGTQFLVIGIAITLIILILLFVVFWKYFMKDTIGGTKAETKSGNFG